MSWRNKFKYSFYILTLGTLIYCFIVGAERMCLPVLFTEISHDLGLSMVQLGTIWGLDPFAGIFVSLFAGLIVDRFGIKVTLAIVCFMSGIMGALRGVSADFITMAVIMFIFGIFVAMIPTVTQKAVAVWFPGKRFVLATSIMNVGGSVGSMFGTMVSATVLSPVLHGWRNVFFAYGIPPVILSLLWLITARAPKNVSITPTKQSVSFRELISHVMRIKEIWIIGLLLLGLSGSGMGIMGYLAAYLDGIGWTSAGSSLAITIYSAAGAVGGVPLALLSNRLGSRMKVLIPAGIIAVISTVFFPYTHGPTLWVLIVINGIARGCVFPLLTTMAVERKAIGVQYAGTAIGLVNTLSMIGGAALSPLGNSLAGIHPQYPFVFWSAISAIALVGFFFIKEEHVGGIVAVSQPGK